MVTDSFLSIACAGLIGVLFGLVLCFAGYRLFVVLLPVWGFVFGLMLGVQTIQVLFGVGFLATVTSWVVGIVIGAIFAVLSYLFYIGAVAVIAGSLGYAATVGILLLFGLDMGILVWIIGIVVAIALAVVTIIFNLQKWVIIIATSLMGAGVIFGGIYVLFNPYTDLLANPIKSVISSNVWLMLLTIVVAICGIVVQYRNNRNFTLDSYNNWA
jgi:hypothetical protein